MADSPRSESSAPPYHTASDYTSLLCPNCGGMPDRPFSKIMSTVSRDLLESNDPAAESQIPSVRDFISRARAQKLLLDAKIALLQPTLDELCSERDELNIEIRKHEGTLSSLRRMPPEILSLIFALAFSQNPGPFEQASAPWTAATVCAGWRTVALSPIFWTTIDNQNSRSHTFSSLRTQLSRSGDLPLTVLFSCYEPYSITTSEFGRLNILVQHSALWETISLEGPEEMYIHIHGTRPQFSMLRKLEVRGLFDTSFPSVLEVFSCAPRLEEVSMKIDMYEYPISPVLLPWHQLSKYWAKSGWQGLSTLASATNLIECALDMGDDEPAVLNLGVVLLPRLLSLSVSHRGLLAYLETPALTELYDCDASSDFSHLRRLPWTLQKLVLTSNADSASLTRMVEALPQIKYLGFIKPLPLQSVRDFLGSVSKRAPKLEHISLAVWESDDVETFFTDFIAAVEGVGGEGHCLRSLEFYSPFFRHPQSVRDILSRLELLRARGVDIQLDGDHFDFYSNTIPETLSLWIDF